MSCESNVGGCCTCHVSPMYMRFGDVDQCIDSWCLASYLFRPHKNILILLVSNFQCGMLGTLNKLFS